MQLLECESAGGCRRPGLRYCTPPDITRLRCDYRYSYVVTASYLVIWPYVISQFITRSSLFLVRSSQSSLPSL